MLDAVPVGLGLPFNHIVNIVIEITDPDATVTAIGAEKDALNYITNFYPPAARSNASRQLSAMRLPSSTTRPPIPPSMSC